VATMTLYRAGWRNPRTLSILLLVFLCGAITGALTLRLAYGNPPPRLGPYWKEGGREISLQKWKRELDLTPDQAAEIEIILDDFVMYYDMLQAQMDDVRASGKAKIMQILKENQRAKFEKMLSELQSKQIR